MFEKDAEEYRKNFNYYQDWHGQVIDKSPSTIVEQAFQESAEFGYNLAKEEIDYLNKHWSSEKERKANEWHYVKDGNPDNENDILCQISKDEVEVGYYHTKQKRYYTIDGQPIDVVRWKDIVLPKESE